MKDQSLINRTLLQPSFATSVGLVSATQSLAAGAAGLAYSPPLAPPESHCLFISSFVSNKSTEKHLTVAETASDVLAHAPVCNTAEAIAVQ